MTEPQLNLLGDHAQPVDGELGPVQRAVVRVMRRQGTIARDEAGAIAHAYRGRHGVDERCTWCGVDGDPIVASLVRRGLAARASDGYIQPAPRLTDTDSRPPSDGGEIPY